MRKFKYDNTIYLAPVPNEIVSYITEIIGFIPKMKITSNLIFDRDLGFEPLDFLDLIMNVERDNRIKIPDDDDINSSMTVGNFVAVVEESIERKEGIRRKYHN